jgi:hypothetical protein
LGNFNGVLHERPGGYWSGQADRRQRLRSHAVAISQGTHSRAGGIGRRYQVNVAKWLAPKGLYRSRCWWEIFYAHFDYPGIEEFHPKASVIELGEALRASLVKVHGPCAVRHLVFDSICEIAPSLCKGLRERFELPRPDPCLTCPPIDLLERVVLGGLVQGTAQIAERVRVTLNAGKSVEISAAEVEKEGMAGVGSALTKFADAVVDSARSVEMLFGSFVQERKTEGFLR